MHVLAAAVDLAERGDVKYLVERFAGGLWKDNYVVFVAAKVDGKAALCCKVSPEAPGARGQGQRADRHRREDLRRWRRRASRLRRGRRQGWRASAATRSRPCWPRWRKYWVDS